MSDGYNALETVTGEDGKKESRSAHQAFLDYCFMGSERSLRKLLALYKKRLGDGSQPEPPTDSRTTIDQWSRNFAWVERSNAYDREVQEKDRRAYEDRRRELLETGLALDFERIAKLEKVADQLEGYLGDPDRVWVPDAKMIGTFPAQERVDFVRFNAPLFDQYRGVIDDIAREVGGRAKKEPAQDNGNGDAGAYRLPADVLAPSFLSSYRAIHSGKYTEFLEYGGRGSTKSSFVSLAIIELIKNHPNVHGLAMRQVKDTLRDSVYAQLQWAIGELGLTNEFRCTTNPMEITYLPTGQKIYFRGADDPGKIKSIKPPFGYIGIVWFEELDQFHGAEAVRKIEQSVMRGGDTVFEFKSWNPPRTTATWVNKYIQIPKATQWKHFSDYLTVPIEWLGQPWIDEAEHLKATNPKAYEHEYLGVPNGNGGLVFENLELRAITDAEIAQFDRIYNGLDWGYFPDPLSFGRMHYDAARHVLYIFSEFRGNKLSNRKAFDDIIKAGFYQPGELVTADSAEPKSINDWRAYGANIRGAEKGPDSVDYSMKWLQSLNKIVIDNVRCPYHAEEFQNYELEQDKNGDFISAYPDKNNHAIDDVRYALNVIWRKRGQ